MNDLKMPLAVLKPAMPLDAVIKPVDVGSLIYDINTSFNPLSSGFIFDYQVSEVRDGYVFLSLAVPEGMTNAFSAILQGMGGLFKFLDMKAKVKAAEKKAQARNVDPVAIAAREKSRAQFTKLCCSHYDKFIDAGHPVKDAIRLTNSALKAQEHPWAAYETVKLELQKAGRFRKKKEVN